MVGMLLLLWLFQRYMDVRHHSLTDLETFAQSLSKLTTSLFVLKCAPGERCADIRQNEVRKG